MIDKVWECEGQEKGNAADKIGYAFPWARFGGGDGDVDGRSSGASSWSIWRGHSSVSSCRNCSINAVIVVVVVGHGLFGILGRHSVVGVWRT